MPNDDWPRCPQCDRPRTTQCPICYSDGSDFTVVDPEYLGAPVDESLSERKVCGCGSTGCAEPAEDTDGGEELEPPCDGMPEPLEFPRMLMCSICDEPFEPTYPIRCEWCGQEFAEGYEVVEPPPSEELSGRLIFVMLALAAFTLSILGYFMYVL